ncbi:hypothetical protein SERLA73DRAFT_183813 [Serpula lacrymans var. lacrymans S7.3]|uniref:Uncharacterized protein n=2 Tax=Serpula lacrymans var. lacrymans TaxID=341189 RepID=F8Q1W1_SERL3|nr:uncharacterized protein SERLADRAFT_471192 [Serpula lacrymans var. lacrymans S7.9]EGN97172.1 hypothetical protein SERLA73DRAFT_183813 [Serpula lacrymans var. lacrymans S7.3]EGO22781.1 hypothetical protein SERLADRAFT_471192 [Serpula lacrymans var. lacrymans S7.9]
MPGTMGWPENIPCTVQVLPGCCDLTELQTFLLLKYLETLKTGTFCSRRLVARAGGTVPNKRELEMN